MTTEFVTPTTILKDHISPETAYNVGDYPYGYTLRCKIRYWLEVSPTRGVRFVSQTTNPKKAGEFWNKPKASTYSRFGGAMFLDANGHVQWAGVHEYMDAGEIRAWLEKYADGNVIPQITAAWLRGKETYEAARAGGADMRQAAIAATAEMRKAGLK